MECYKFSYKSTKNTHVLLFLQFYQKNSNIFKKTPKIHAIVQISNMTKFHYLSKIITFTHITL